MKINFLLISLLFVISLSGHVDASDNRQMPASLGNANDSLLPIIDPYGNKTHLAFDEMNRLKNILKTNSAEKKLAEANFDYDSQGNRICETHQVLRNGHSSGEYRIWRHFDDGNRLLSITEEGDELNKTTRYSYYPSGQLQKIIKPDGVAIDYVYNETGGLVELKASDGSLHYTYQYDASLQLTAIQDLCHGYVQNRFCHPSGRLEEEWQSPSVKMGYQYDSEGRLTALTLPDGSQIAYRYRDAYLVSIDRLSADQSLLYSHIYERDANGIIKRHHLANGIGTVEVQYNDNDRLVGVASEWWSQRCTEFDACGRLKAMEIQDAGKTLEHRFAYSDEGMLIEENGSLYTFDSLSNCIADREQEWKINGLNQLIQTAHHSYAYDTNGNLIEKQSKTSNFVYAYDALNRLCRIESPDLFAWTYIYDAFHRRLEQKAWKWNEAKLDWTLEKTEKFLFDGFNEIGKVDERGNILELRILGEGLGAEIGAAVAMELQGKLFVPIHDCQGSVRCLIDANSGQLAESYAYTAFGREEVRDGNRQLLESPSRLNPWRYGSKRINDQTGLIFFGKRDYDPHTRRWISPDPLFFCDTPNLYAFARNDPLNCVDLYGLFSINQMWESFLKAVFDGFNYLQVSAHQTKMKWGAELKLPPYVNHALESFGKALFGESFYLLMGPHFEETQVDSYGQQEISDKVRMTFINGILNTRTVLKETLNKISDGHGGVKIHYVFRPTEGWTWDISRGIMIRTAYLLGFRSLHAHLLAQLWRALIEEMGGVDGGGTIIHYAHSLGGADTNSARDLLSPEEQKMIRVVTFGSPAFIKNEGFQSVVNHVSVNDGVASPFLEPLGYIRNFFDPDSNVRFHSSFFQPPYWPSDHLLTSPTYETILQELGKQFVAEFGSDSTTEALLQK